MPDQFFGRPTFPLEIDELNWLEDLPKDTYFALWPCIPSSSNNPINLPLGHSTYVLLFHQERFDTEWVMSQAARISEPIIVLCDGSDYDFPFLDNVYFYQYHSWHEHIHRIIQRFPNQQTRTIKYKISNICNRITQSKAIVFTALMEYIKREELLVKLSDWVELKNVHHWVPTGNSELDGLMSTFQSKWLGKTIAIDEFNNAIDNNQHVNSNPWQSTYLESALHFVGESFHYSRMINEFGDVIIPGPSFSEKLYKCLIAGTPFVPVGQFESYKHLRDLGFEFDYGELDLSWDNDPGNITRMQGIVNLIKSLANYTTNDIELMTRNSTEHNNDYVWSGDFRKKCQDNNEQTANKILNKFR